MYVCMYVCKGANKKKTRYLEGGFIYSQSS